jgi:hypothetical protein
VATAGRRSLDSGEGYGRSALGGAAGDPVGSGAIRPVFGHRFPIEVDAVTSLRTVGHMVQTYTDTFEAIEAAVADARELRRIDRRVLVDERLDDEEREHLRRRIGFYLSDMHLRLRPHPEILPLKYE